MSMSDSTEYYTKCCHLYFVGLNHNPMVSDGITNVCRNCNYHFIPNDCGYVTKKQFKEAQKQIADKMVKEILEESPYESALKYGIKND